MISIIYQKKDQRKKIKNIEIKTKIKKSIKNMKNHINSYKKVKGLNEERIKVKLKGLTP